LFPNQFRRKDGNEGGQDNMDKQICGETLVDKDGNVKVCQRPPHKIYPSAKHWDDRGGWHGWSEAFAERQREQQREQQQHELTVSVKVEVKARCSGQ